jgi:hypothetical protein
MAGGLTKSRATTTILRVARFFVLIWMQIDTREKLREVRGRSVFLLPPVRQMRAVQACVDQVSCRVGR